MRIVLLASAVLILGCSSGNDPGPHRTDPPLGSTGDGPVPWNPEPESPAQPGATCDGACDARVPTQCSCDPADPCGWVGDGVCDDACAVARPQDALDDSADCAGSGGSTGSAPDACGSDCANGWLNPCTCAAADPCGWANDGECDDECLAIAPGASFDDTADCGGGAGGGGGGTGAPGEPGTCSLVVPGATGQEHDGTIPVCCTPSVGDRAAIDEAFQLLNQHRVSKGRAPLAYDPLLEAAIQGHCEHMVAHDFFSHDAPENVVSSPWDRAAMCGTQAGGENIAWGYQSASEVMNGWRWSPGHNANMLNGGFTRVGIGKAGTMWGQLFGW